jgi:uncharacterized SAM-binding protein YcdF (DUF218 family)
MSRPRPGNARLAWIARTLGAPLAIRDPLAVADAIVVLGAPLTRRGAMTDVLAERVDAAAALWHAQAAPLVCPTGADTGGGRSEAHAMAEGLIDRGVPAHAIRVEPRARSTAENAARVAELLRADAVARVWLVTQPFHGRRARWLFRRAGLDVRVWAIDDGLQAQHPARALRWIAREYAAWAGALARGSTR